MHSIDGHIAETGLGTANLHIFAFTFIALQGNARQAAESVRNISVRQAGDDFGGQHLNDVVGGAFAIERFDLAALALSTNYDLLVDSSDVEDSLNIGDGAGCDDDFTGEGLEPNVGDCERVFIWHEIRNREFALSVRSSGVAHRLQSNTSADQWILVDIHGVAGERASPFLGIDGRDCEGKDEEHDREKHHY